MNPTFNETLLQMGFGRPSVRETIASYLRVVAQLTSAESVFIAKVRNRRLDIVLTDEGSALTVRSIELPETAAITSENLPTTLPIDAQALNLSPRRSEYRLLLAPLRTVDGEVYASVCGLFDNGVHLTAARNRMLRQAADSIQRVLAFSQVHEEESSKHYFDSWSFWTEIIKPRAQVAASSGAPLSLFLFTVGESNRGIGPFGRPSLFEALGRLGHLVHRYPWPGEIAAGRFRGIGMGVFCQGMDVDDFDTSVGMMATLFATQFDGAPKRNQPPPARLSARHFADANEFLDRGYPGLMLDLIRGLQPIAEHRPVEMAPVTGAQRSDGS